jgi:hypothetical protein
MITEADINNWFEYHKPSESQLPLYSKLREAAKSFAQVVMECTPPSPDQTTAIRKIREAVMTANAAIACDQLRIDIEEVAGVVTFRSYWRTSEQDNMIGKYDLSKMEIMAVGNVRKLLHTFVKQTVGIIDNHQVREERVWKAVEQACHSKSLSW